MNTTTVIGDEPETFGPPELIVITTAESATVGQMASALGDTMPALRPLFGESTVAASPGAQPGADDDLARYFVADVPEEEMEATAARLLQSDAVEAAYVKPPAALASIIVEERPPAEEAPSHAPNYRSRQLYLDAAPVGIDAPYAWGINGGRGDGIQVIDCEWGWNTDHEDLLANNIGVVVGSPTTTTSFVNHGTAVWGEIGGDAQAVGVRGIANQAKLGAASFVTMSSAEAIKRAADASSPGDILLLEIHRPGPNATQGGQQGYIAIEWWPDDYAAIRYAVAKGVIVVEAAGNGWEDLDAALYNVRPAGFPASWTNPFNTTNPSSGAVMVGAGDPPSGTHGRTNAPGSWSHLPYVDRARCGFSNWGQRIDAQGWGWEVTTTGYGDLQGGTDDNRWYTDTFSGTSSASPIVTGALACTQGVLKATGMPLLDSGRARTLLRSTGSPQQAAAGRPLTQRIGNRPNLRQLIPAALKTWVTNGTIRYCYTSVATEFAHAYIDGYGWRRIQPGFPEGVSKLFDVATTVQSTNGKANLYIDDSHLYSIIQL